MARYRQRGVFGFTVVELFVVFAIIAILAGILYPVLARASAKAREAERKARKSAPTIEITKEIPANIQHIKLKSPSGKTTWVSVLD